MISSRPRIAPHLLYPQMLDDSEPEQRAIALKLGHRLLSVCQEVWACGSRISSGMAGEIALAETLCIPVRYLLLKRTIADSCDYAENYDIPVTQTCLTSIWQRQPRPGAIWPTSRQYPRANGRRPLPLVSPFAMPASDFSSAQPVIPLTLRPWTNWEASSGAGRTSPRRRHMKCQRQQPLRQPRRPPQNQ